MANKIKIENALGEVREHLILNKYNDAMMLMAQITIDVIEHLIDEALIVSKGYEKDLDILKSNGIIGEDTAHNFETLIISGAQAHSGVDIPKEHAEQALQVLTNELDIIFKNENVNPSISENLEGKADFNANNKSEEKVFEYDEGEDIEPYPGDFSKDMTTDGAIPAFLQKDNREDYRQKEKMRAQILQTESSVKKKKKRIKLIAILIPIIAILLVVFLVRTIGKMISGGERETLSLPTETIYEVIETETTEPETTLPAHPEAGFYTVTGSAVSVRDAATTEGSKKLAIVNKGDKVQVKEFYNIDWAIILYDGREAYISRQYIERDETLSPIVREE